MHLHQHETRRINATLGNLDAAKERQGVSRASAEAPRSARPVHLTRFEQVGQPVATRYIFIRRLVTNILVTFILVGGSLVGGVIGYHYAEGWSWIDSFEEAAMILSGMGPVGDSQTSGGKMFAALYAMWSGLVLVAATGIILTPFIHRVLHHFHAEK